MVVYVMENVSNSLRGLLTRWLLEVKAGVFIGNINQMVRNLLWEKICDSNNLGSSIMIFTTNNEQGFDMKMFGVPHRKIIDFEGIKLISVN